MADFVRHTLSSNPLMAARHRALGVAAAIVAEGAASLVQRQAATAPTTNDDTPDDEVDYAPDDPVISTSGISLDAVIFVLAGFAGAFTLVVLIGVIIRFTNKPKTVNGVGVGLGQNELYQPSASGYKGTIVASADGPAPAEGGPRLIIKQGPVTPQSNLLDQASEMGMSDYPPMPPSAPGPGGRAGGSHGRLPSSGVALPGPSAAARRGFGTAHPPVGGGAPDGGGFRPGQMVNPRQGGPGGPPNGYGPGRRPGGPPGGPGAPPSHLRQQRGPPPANDGRRQSRYRQSQVGERRSTDRRSRIDSIGPGTYRKSQYLPADFDVSKMGSNPPDAARNGGGQGGLRRVESIGRGDSRSRNGQGGPGRNASLRRGQAANPFNDPPMINMVDQQMLISAQTDRFGAGRLNSPAGSPMLGPSSRPGGLPGQQRGPSPMNPGQRSPGGGQIDPLGARRGPGGPPSPQQFPSGPQQFPNGPQGRRPQPGAPGPRGPPGPPGRGGYGPGSAGPPQHMQMSMGPSGYGGQAQTQRALLG